MANIIKIKRGSGVPGTSDLSHYELGYRTGTQELYVNDGGTIRQIGGAGGGGSSNLSVANQSNNALITATGTTDSLNAEANLTFGGSHLKLLVDGGKFIAGAGEDFSFHHSGTHSWIDNLTGNLYIRNQTDDGQIIMQTDDGSGGTTTYMSLKGNEQLIRFIKSTRHNDNVFAQFGTSNDFKLKHDGSNSYITNDTGNLFINQTTDDGDIIFKTDDGSGGITPYITLDGSLTKNVLNVNTRVPDSVIIGYGSSDDLQIYHNGTNSFGADNYTGALIFQQRADDQDIIFKNDDGSGGVTAYLTLDGSAVRTVFDKAAQFNDGFFFPDSAIAYFGTNNDLRIQHNGNHSFIQQYGTGDLYIDNTIDDKSIIFRTDDGTGGVTAYLKLDGSAGNLNFYNKALVAIGGIQLSEGDFKMPATSKLYLDGGNNTYIFEESADNVIHYVGGQNKLRFNSTGTILNDAGLALDFRVEGDTDDHLFFVDGSADRVGISTNAPQEELDISGSLKVRGDSAAATEVLELGQFVSPNITTPQYTFNTYDAAGGLPSMGDHLEIRSVRWGQSISFSRNGQGGAVPTALFYNASSSGYMDLYKATNPTTDATYTNPVRLNVNGHSWLNGGNIGINTTSPADRLHIYESGNASIRIQGAGGQANIRYQNDAQSWYAGINVSEQFYWYSSELGATTNMIHVNGDFYTYYDFLISNNNRALEGRDTSGAIRNLIKIDSSNRVQIGDANAAGVHHHYPSTYSQINTDHGYLQIGPQNGSHCHFMSDIGNFYTTSFWYVNNGITLSSYNQDVEIRRNNSSADRFNISADYSRIIVNNSERFRATTSGATVTGDLTVTGNMAITGNNDATTLDGYDSSRFFRRQGSASATVGPGWMTVATSTSGRRAGEILVTDGDSGDHGFIRIHWLRSYMDSNFTVINCGGHQNRITGVRVLSQDSDNTYGEKILQVYVTASSSYEAKVFLMGDNNHYSEHTVHTPTIENSITGYSVHGNQLENLDTYGFAHEEGILAGGNIKTGGRVYAGDGTSAFPAYSFDSDTNTGIIRYGSDDMRFVAGGDARFSANGNGLDLSVNSATKIVHNSTSTRDKYRLWNSGTYAIGMQTNFTFGGLDTDYAMTFQMSNTASRGFWFGDNNHGQSGGAMAVTTDGKLTVAHSMRLGYGETDQTTPGSTFTMDISGNNNLKLASSADQMIRFARSGGNEISIEHDTSQIYFYNRATSKAMFLMLNSGSAIMGYNSNPSLEIRNTATSAGSGPSLVFGHDQSGTNSTGRISTYLTDGSQANRTGLMRLWHRHQGTEYLKLQLGDNYVRQYQKGDTSDYLETLVHNDYVEFHVAHGNYVQVNTNSGVLDIGPMNASWNHFQTDRPGNYFNKKVTVDTGIIESYDENLDLRRAQSSNDRIVIEADQHSHYVNGSKRLEVKGTGIRSHGANETTTYFSCRQNGATLKRYVSTWNSGNQTQDVILNSYASNIGDYVYLKASGNTTTNHGIIVAADSYIFMGRDDLVEGALDNSATAPISDVYCRIDTSGNALFDGDVVAYSSTIASDARLKENVKDLNYGLKDILDIRPVSFDWKDKRDGQHDIGVIAQEIEKIIPEVVVDVDTLNSEEDTHKTVDYAKLTSVLIKAVQEQQQQINELKEKLNG